jgi:hypothetical protein
MIGYSKAEKKWYILDVTGRPAESCLARKAFIQTCKLDRDRAKQLGARFMVRWEIEPGSAAKRDSYRMTTNLAGYDAKGRTSRATSSPGLGLSRSRPRPATSCSSKGSWNSEFLSHMHGQPDLPHDDIMDAAAGAFNSTDRGRLEIVRFLIFVHNRLSGSARRSFKTRPLAPASPMTPDQTKR